MKKTMFERCVSVAVIGVCLIKAVLYGGSKPPATTNTPPDNISGDGSSTNDPPLTMCLATPTPNLYTYTSLSNWTARGAWIDWVNIQFPSDFRFPLGTNLIDGVTLMSQGALRVSLTNVAALAELPEPVSFEPGVSSASYGLTPSNSFLFAWENVCVGRDPTNRINATMELLPNGAIAITTQYGDQLPTTSYQLPTLPPGFVGEGQDEAWVTNAFPAVGDAILAMGYDSWVTNYVGVDEMNGRYQAAVTIAALPESGAPCYLVCGPYKVNVTAPGTYRFPLEVFDVYETRTYPETVPLSVVYDDGYTGEEESFEMVDVTDDPPLLMMALAAPLPTSTSRVLRNYMWPKVVVTPNRIPLETAEGTHVDLWCNMANVSDWFYRATRELYLNFCFPTDAEILEAEIECTVEFILEDLKGYCSGSFDIYRTNVSTNETNVVARTDASVFSGAEWQGELTNDLSIIHLTAVTTGGSTEENLATAAIQFLEGQSVYVGVFLASSEHPGDPAMPYYDDTVGWQVLSSGVTMMAGSGSAADWSGPTAVDSYAGLANPVFLGGGRIEAASDETLHLRLIATAQNAIDGLRETAVQIVVYPIDDYGNVIGLPWWAF